MFKITTALLAAALLVVPAASMAQSKGKPTTTTTTVPVGGGPVTAEGLITRYQQIAGSEANAKSLVNGLRNGNTVELTGTTQVEVQVPVETQVTETVQVPFQVPAPPPAPPGTFVTVCCRTQTVTRTVITYRTEIQTITESLSFTPPTGNMGWGDVNLSLAFTEAQLTEIGIGTPTPRQLIAVLMSGEVEYGNATPKLKKVFDGVLVLRAKKMGWGQIAAQFGYKLQ